MYLGIDLGTSGVKAVLMDDAGLLVHEATAPLEVSRPHPLWSEQDPADWWAATGDAVKSLPRDARAKVRAVGLSGQMHGATLLDENHKVLRPAILWNDGRSADDCVWLEKELPSFSKITGNKAMPGFTAPKLVWVRRHEPEIFKATKLVLLPKDYLRLLMTGDAASDMSDSAGTVWMDVAKRDWSNDVLAACDLTRGHMPKLFEGSDQTGKMLPKIAEDWGIPVVPVAGGGGDNAAGAVGAGVTKPGEAMISLGTSGVVFLADDQYRPNPESGVHTFCHALPKAWHEMAVMLSAASAIDWVAGVTGYKSPADLYEATADRAKTTTSEYFLPYLSGERTPHNNANAKGMFFGLTHESDTVSLGQAALEGVAFGLADGLQALRATGASIETISVIGGGSRSGWWGDIIAAITGETLTYREGSAIGPAVGAARLARLCVGDGTLAEIATAPPVSDVVEPKPDLQALFSARHDIFQKLYQTTKTLTQEN